MLGVGKRLLACEPFSADGSYRRYLENVDIFRLTRLNHFVTRKLISRHQLTGLLINEDLVPNNRLDCLSAVVSKLNFVTVTIDGSALVGFGHSPVPHFVFSFNPEREGQSIRKSEVKSKKFTALPADPCGFGDSSVQIVDVIVSVSDFPLAA